METKEYRVTWAIDVDASSPLEAARTVVQCHPQPVGIGIRHAAAQLQADPDSTAHVYDVSRWDRPLGRVDLGRVTVSPIPTPTPTEPHGHTPAPWVVRSGAIYSAAGVPIAQMHREPGNGTTPTERDANARHIVDAVNLLPALVTVLRAFVDTCQCHGRARGDHSILCNRARAALALVDGPPTPETTDGEAGS